uniref:RPA-interacting protein C-terminal domain-containing protein n=1 Tax=Glossina brevipalpis TaxID=37001 RepID=A0A1A9WKC8_9MUSC
MECPTNPICKTTIEQKLKAQKAAKLYRLGSPKLRDLLREKCRIRFKEARRNSHDRMRAINEEGEDQEEIYNEFIEEINKWFAEQQEEEENYFEGGPKMNALICPVCQKGTLVVYLNKDSRYNYRCRCGISFFDKDPEILRSLLAVEIDKHEQFCSKPLIFFVDPLMQQLEGICEACDYFSCL